jgi:hypothetical protein
MYLMRRATAVLLMGLVLALSARAAPVDLRDAATRQAELKRQFGTFKEKLVLLAARLEASTKAEDREKAKSLRKAIQIINAREVDGKFDTILRGLRTPGADKDTDLLAQILKDNKGLRDDLKQIITIMMATPRPDDLRARQDKIEKLMDQLKELRSKQARLQALAELGRHTPAELGKAQDKISKLTEAVLAPKSKPSQSGSDNEPDKSPYPDDPEDPAPKEMPRTAQLEGDIGDKNVEAEVRKQIEEARRRMGDAQGKLGQSNRNGAADDMGRAVGHFDNAIRELDKLLRQLRKEEMLAVLADLKQRCERMLQIQKEVRDGTVALDAEVQKLSDKQPTVAQRARANALADKEGLIVKEVEGALKVLASEGSAIAFRMTFEQVGKDASAVQKRLNKANTDRVTVAVENQIIQTLEEMIEALKKQIRDTETPPPPGPGGEGPNQPRKPLIELLAELKMIYALQKRVNARTELYGKEYPGEQAPMPGSATTPAQRELYEMIRQELTDLSASQKAIGGVTKNLGIAVATRERQ